MANDPDEILSALMAQVGEAYARRLDEVMVVVEAENILAAGDDPWRA